MPAMPQRLVFSGLVLAFLIIGASAVRAQYPNPPAAAPESQLFVPMVQRSPNEPAAAPTRTPSPTPSAPTAFEQQVFDMVNQERANAACGPLSINAKLTATARGHSEDMALNDYFSHTGLDGSSVSERAAAGYHFSWIGENIAAGQSSPESVMAGWMQSPGHRANILRCEYREIGVGYYYQADDQANVRLDNGSVSGPFRHYWTQVFGTAR